MRRLTRRALLISAPLFLLPACLVFTAQFAFTAQLGAAEPVRVASKKFTEGALLGELATIALEASDIPAQHQSRLGGTTVCFRALETGAIDVYADYTGTLIRELLAELELEGFAELKAALAERGIGITQPIGFDNTYALAMRAAHAKQLGITKISDLEAHPTLRLGFGPEFVARKDCWPGLRSHYRLGHETPTSIQHELAYGALDNNEIDVMEVYTTDAKIPKYDITLLEDDQKFFPRYQAVYLYRAALIAERPNVGVVLHSFEGKIATSAMQKLNAQVETHGLSEPKAAAAFLRDVLELDIDEASAVQESTLAQRVLQRTREHLFLVIVSLGLGILVSVPLGWVCATRRRVGQVILGVAGVIQTIPSLALLVFMIPILGIEAPPAIAALFLYTLLPILRGTYTGLTTIQPELQEVAVALGLPAGSRRRRIELPLAMPSILSGIKIAAVVNVGFATLGAFIGAGGYGAPILTGIDLQNTAMILEGAIPAAALAILAQATFEVVEHFLVPRGLRVRPVEGAL